MLTGAAEKAREHRVAGSSVFNNTGGPRSRLRTEPVSECYFSRSPGAVETGCYAFGVHDSVNYIHTSIYSGRMAADDLHELMNCIYYKRLQVFQVGDLSVTPYWADHSTFDSYSLCLKAGGR